MTTPVSNARPGLASTPVRLAWPDVARGMSILGVVMLHVTLAVPEGLDTWLARLNAVLDPMRLPLFFIISGYFSTKVLGFSFLQLFCRRLWFFLVPYVVWSYVELTSNSFLYHLVFDDPIRSAKEKLEFIELGHSMGWFLHALILYNIFLWVVRKLPVWAALVLSFLPMTLLGFEEQYYAIGKATMFLPVFVAGVYLRPQITAFANAVDRFRRPDWKVSAAFLFSIVSFWAGRCVRHSWDNRATYDPVVNWPLPGAEFLGRNELFLLVRFVEQSLELPMAIALAVLLSHVPFVSGLLRFVGSHTLPIYLGHPIALTVGFGLLQAHFQWPITVAGKWPVENTDFWIVVCFFFAALGAMALWIIQKVPVLGWLVKPPRLEWLEKMFSAHPAAAHPTPATVTRGPTG